MLGALCPSCVPKAVDGLRWFDVQTADWKPASGFRLVLPCEEQGLRVHRSSFLISARLYDISSIANSLPRRLIHEGGTLSTHVDNCDGSTSCKRRNAPKKSSGNSREARRTNSSGLGARSSSVDQKIAPRALSL